jgi:predicted CXXCH cytochrome family protein
MKRIPHTRERSPGTRRWRLIAWTGLGLVALSTTAGLVGAGTTRQERPTRRHDVCVNDACHTGVVGRKEMHAPAAKLDCMECHEYVDTTEHLFRLTRPRKDLCTPCHTMTHEAVVHAPLVDGNCTGCHDPHGSDRSMFLVAELSQALCLTCHEQDYAQMEHVHGPVAVGACVICHDPHSSPEPGLLTDAPDRLCLDCHGEMAAVGAARRHLHQPMEEGCTSCHDPHASNFEFQLERPAPAICFTCHDGVRNVVERAVLVHGPTTEEGGCTSCHNPHFSPLPRLQRRQQPDLCLDCHSEPIEASNGQTLTNMALLLEDNPNHHGPIRDGSCTACHNPHAGERFGLLFEEYPPEFYAPFEIDRYALCFGCHIPELVEDESGTGLTRFRDGDRNLHWLHVNREKGRTCRACHEVHASQRPFHIREAVPFGNRAWMLEINFEQTADGGSCSPGCHKPKEYRRTVETGAAETGP